MNSVAAPVAGLTPSVNDKTVLQRVSEIAGGPLAEAAHRIDREGYYPLDIMARLAEVGAFGAHLDRRGADFGLALAATSEIARSCGSTGFLAWCHNVCGLYMEQSANPALLERLNDHVEGRRFGGTALSNPMKAMAGIEPMLLRAQRVPGGYRVSGSLPWVSHIAPGSTAARSRLSNGPMALGPTRSCFCSIWMSASSSGIALSFPAWKAPAPGASA